MSYEINRRDGSVLTTVRDGVIRRDVVPISLIGRGSLGFGDSMNENFLHLLENLFKSAMEYNFDLIIKHKYLIQNLQYNF